MSGMYVGMSCTSTSGMPAQPEMTVFQLSITKRWRLYTCSNMCTAFFRIFATKKRRKSSHAHYLPFKMTVKERACAVFVAIFVAKILKTAVSMHTSSIWFPGMVTICFTLSKHFK